MLRDNDDSVARLVVTLMALALATMLVFATGCSTNALEQEVTYDQGVGQPLDAVQFKAPTWATGKSSWLVTDRQTGQEWWLVEMRTGNVASFTSQWVVLPRGDWDVND